MSGAEYTFTADAGGDTFLELQDLVLGNTFSAVKYREQSKKLLNDAVTEACRKLRVHRAQAVCAFSAAGVVTQPTTPFFRIDEVWLAATGATGTGEQAMATYAASKLEPLPAASPAEMGGGEFYVARRKLDPTTRYPQLEIVVVDPGAAGSVVISGLQRPAVMDEDTDLTGLGADLDWAVVAYAKAKLFLLEDDPEMAGVWANEFQGALNTAAQTSHQDGPDITPGTYEDDAHPQRGV